MTVGFSPKTTKASSSPFKLASCHKRYHNHRTIKLHMLKYKQKRDLSDENKAPAGLSFYPTFETCEPTIGISIVRFYSLHGEYLGWCTDEVAKKFFYGKLYYKTKGAYTIKTRRSYRRRATRKIYIYEKASKGLAAYAVKRALDDNDMVDTSDKRALAVSTLNYFKTMSYYASGLDSFHDPYSIVPNEIRNKFRNDLANFVELKRNELIAICQREIDASDVLNEASTTAGVSLDI